MLKFFGGEPPSPSPPGGCTFYLFFGRGVKNEKWSEFAEMVRNLIGNCFRNFSKLFSKFFLKKISKIFRNISEIFRQNFGNF
jgi:hypothetical protein